MSNLPIFYIIITLLDAASFQSTSWIVKEAARQDAKLGSAGMITGLRMAKNIISARNSINKPAFVKLIWS